MTAVGPFRCPVRVYYEDTDAGGVVDYANYLRFPERARTEWLASLGFTLTALQRDYHTLFVVHRLDIEFRRPAHLYDALEVTLTLTSVGRSRLAAVQDVLRAARAAGRRAGYSCLHRSSEFGGRRAFRRQSP